jgi:hypothetical protein
MWNFAFPGYAKHVWTRSAIRPRHPLSEVRKASTVWRQVATARGPESWAAKSVLGICGGADTEFRMDRSREQSLKHQTCRLKECASVMRKVACNSSKLHASHSQTLTHKRRWCQLLHRSVVSYIR